MADSAANKNKWVESLQNNYKIVIMDEEDLREVSTYSLSLKNIYLLILFTCLILATSVVSLIVFTPLKSLIPGYGKLENDKAYQELFVKIEDLENKLKAQDVYTIGLQNMLKGIEESSGQKILTPKEIESIQSVDIIESEKTGALNNFLFTPPMTGSISNEYDPTAEHFGIDVLAPQNTPVKAIQDGVIINSGWSDEAGNMVYIQHPKNVISVYKHNSKLLVKTGQRVSTGQAIAIIGNTGTLSSGPHLHFELWYDGLPVNPVNYIAF
jgi:murein DD-endopeptidase MepM/ murein hydrolase activator NlpD